MITIPKYKISEFEDIRNGYNFGNRIDLKFASEITCLYYEFAYYQILGFSDTYNKFFKEAPDDHDSIISYLNQSWSQAYAIYALLRTCIEAIRKINKGLLSENQISDHYKYRIKEIIDITNDIIKHPMFNNTNDSSDTSIAYRPISLDIGGEIDVERWIDQSSPSDTLKISPMRDFETVQNYIKHIAQLLKPE